MISIVLKDINRMTGGSRIRGELGERKCWGMAECYSMAARSKTSRSDAGNRRKLAMANLCQDTSSKYRYLTGFPHLFKSMLVLCHSGTKAGTIGAKSLSTQARQKCAYGLTGALHSLGTDWRLPAIDISA